MRASETVEGTLEAIELHDINKARGHHTYNVELVVARDGGQRVRVRVAKLYWGRLSAAQRDELAPDGPAGVLRPTRWGPYAVGERVSLPVRFTSPGLALLQPSAPTPETGRA